MNIDDRYIKRLQELVRELADTRNRIEQRKERVPVELVFRIDYLTGYVESLELLIPSNTSNK